VCAVCCAATAVGGWQTLSLIRRLSLRLSLRLTESNKSRAKADDSANNKENYCRAHCLWHTQRERERERDQQTFEQTSQQIDKQTVNSDCDWVFGLGLGLGLLSTCYSYAMWCRLTGSLARFNSRLKTHTHVRVSLCVCVGVCVWWLVYMLGQCFSILSGCICQLKAFVDIQVPHWQCKSMQRVGHSPGKAKTNPHPSALLSPFPLSHKWGIATGPRGKRGVARGGHKVNVFLV